MSQGEVIGFQGNEGHVSGSQCSIRTNDPNDPNDDEDPTGAHLHFKVVCNGSAVKPEPMSEFVWSDYTNNGIGKVLRGDGFQHYPVGTLIKVPGRPEIYLVASGDEVMHVPDWFTFTSHRFFYDPAKPNQRVVSVSQTALDCYKQTQGNSSWGEYELVSCGDGDYMLFRENGGAFLRRKVPFTPIVDLRYEPLLRSWGLSYDDRRTGSSGECNPLAATGGQLTMRPGTIVEEASDNDFWVITASEYRGDDAKQWFPTTKALRVNRLNGGVPFMPLVFGSYDQVIQIPGGSVGSFVSDQNLGSSFQESDALVCPAASGSGSGGGVSGAGSRPCSDTAQRACWNVDYFIYCEEVSLGVLRWSQPSLCGVGYECTNREGQCTPVPSNCTPNETVCYGSTHEATCTYNPNTGLYDFVPSECPAGYECVATSTQCAEKAPDPNADPPHTIRCVNHDYTYSMIVTGPVQDGLWATVSGQDIYLEYGSNSDGWYSYEPSVGSKPSSRWVGDADGLGNPYVHELVMKGNVDQMNLFLYSPDSQEQEWFNLDWSIWTVTGDCWQDASGIRHDPLPPPSGTVTCTQEGSEMRYQFDGPTQMLLAGGAAVGPQEIQFGSNTNGWTVPAADRPSVPWNGTYHHEIVLPISVNELNFYLHGSGGGQWFDLVDADWDGDLWEVAGDCWADGGLIKHATASPLGVIECDDSGGDLIVRVIGDVRTGIFGTAPTGTVYLEYGSDTDGWAPYTSGKPMAAWTESVWSQEMTLALGVQNMNFFLYAPGTSQVSWFDLNQWNVTGDCWRDGGGIRH